MARVAGVRDGLPVLEDGRVLEEDPGMVPAPAYTATQALVDSPGGARARCRTQFRLVIVKP